MSNFSLKAIDVVCQMASLHQNSNLQWNDGRQH